MGFLSNLWNDITGVTAAQTAAAQQQAGTQAGIDYQKQMVNKMEGLLSPYMQAGGTALNQQQALSGALGAEAQQAAISGIESSPLFQSQLAAGQNAILQNASATGGLRGGNTQGALAQYAPQLLNQAVSNQYGMLGGLSSMGANAATNIGSAGLGSGVSGMLGQMGQQQASSTLGQYNLQRSFLGDLAGFGLEIAELF